MAHLMPRIALSIGLSIGVTWWAHAQSATQQMHAFDQTTYRGRAQVFVDLFPPADKGGKDASPERYPAELLFERPDRFRLTVRPGTKTEFRAVAEAGVLRWLDLGTGFHGKEMVDKVTDPFALALLGTAGELKSFSALEDLPVEKDSPVLGARIRPQTWGGSISDGAAWFSRDGEPLGFEFQLHDGSRVFVSIMQFEQNPQLSAEDFRL